MELASVPEHAVIQGMFPQLEQLGLKSETAGKKRSWEFIRSFRTSKTAKSCHVTAVLLGEVSKSGPRVSESHTSQMSLVKIQLTDRKYSFCPYWGASDTPAENDLIHSQFLASYCEAQGRALGS